MTVREYVRRTDCKVLCEGGDSTVAGAYACDFLSHAMRGVCERNVWFTVMANVNVAGVAALTECACVVLCEGVKADSALLARCGEKGLWLLSTTLPVYEAAVQFSRL
jgi:hypothetical protein